MRAFCERVGFREVVRAWVVGVPLLAHIYPALITPGIHVHGLDNFFQRTESIYNAKGFGSEFGIIFSYLRKPRGGFCVCTLK